MKEQKIASLQQGKDKLQLIRLTEISLNYGMECYTHEKFQVRLNRKRIFTDYSEYQARKVFAQYAQNIVLQLKLC